RVTARVEAVVDDRDLAHGDVVRCEGVEALAQPIEIGGDVLHGYRGPRAAGVPPGVRPSRATDTDGLAQRGREGALEDFLDGRAAGLEVPAPARGFPVP